jgi:hypothetical protein
MYELDEKARVYLGAERDRWHEVMAIAEQHGAELFHSYAGEGEINCDLQFEIAAERTPKFVNALAVAGFDSSIKLRGQRLDVRRVADDSAA